MLLDSLLGTRVTLWLGVGVAAPAPAPIAEAIESIEVTQNSDGQDGFQITFAVGRGDPWGIVDYPVFANPLLRPMNRVIIQVWLGILPQVLIDGFITNHQVTPSNEPGKSTLTITGEDLRVIMDLREFSMSYPGMPPEVRVTTILAKYALYLGAAPVVIPAKIPDVPLPIDRIPAQASTDLAYIKQLATYCDHVFYIHYTSVPMSNIGYWGPERSPTNPFALIPQSALSINLGPHTNVDSLNFQYNALSPETVLGSMQEKQTGAIVPIITPPISTRTPLALLPALAVQQPFVRSVLAQDLGGLDPVQALARAQAISDRSTDVLTAEGELDVTRYNGLLQARRLVGVRGAGWLLDGFYYVKRVTHKIKRGEYKQSFSLVREGFGSLSPVVIP